MTSTEQPSATTDYQTSRRVKATPDALFEGLTTVTGLAAWWNPATGSGFAITASPTNWSASTCAPAAGTTT